jgi:tRNA (mo5U34)-methyltransferase
MVSRPRDRAGKGAAPSVQVGNQLALSDARLTELGWTRETLGKEIAGREWFHQINLGGDVLTPGRDPTATKLDALELPDLTGRSVIDIGAFDGFFTFAAEQRGAARIVAADHWAWVWPGVDARRNFELLHEVLDSAAEMQIVPVEEMSAETSGTFDVVLFLGVLYHAPDMLRYLRAVRSVTREMLVLETQVDCLDIERPVAAYYPRGTFPGDDSNHWGPNPACVEGLLERAGFPRVERKSLWWSDVRSAEGEHKPGEIRTNGRMVFHAWV